MSLSLSSASSPQPYFNFNSKLQLRVISEIQYFIFFISLPISQFLTYISTIPPLFFSIVTYSVCCILARVFLFFFTFQSKHLYLSLNFTGSCFLLIFVLSRIENFNLLICFFLITDLGFFSLHFDYNPFEVGV
jgi:hypothetical protein